MICHVTFGYLVKLFCIFLNIIVFYVILFCSAVLSSLVSGAIQIHIAIVIVWSESGSEFKSRYFTARRNVARCISYSIFCLSLCPSHAVIVSKRM